MRYEADDRPPRLLSFGLGLQAAVLVLSAVVLVPAIMLQATGQSAAYVSWAVFVGLLIGGLITILQAFRIGRFGTGYTLITGIGYVSVAVLTPALNAGGPALLAPLIIVSSLIQFVVGARLSMLRHIMTPVVTGTVLLLIAITTMTLAFDMISDPPEGTASAPVLICAIATLVTIAAIALRVSGFWRLWVMTIGVGVGWIVAALLGIYDLSRLSEVPWIGVPVFAWPGFIVQFDADFWLFLVVVLFVMLITTIESASDMVAVQAVSWRRPRAIDFRAVQGAVNACALSNLLSGIAGGMPTATYGGSCASLIELTGVGARNVGVSAGIVFILLAFLPKVTALLVSIPSPVIAAYVMVLAALLFMQGVRIIAQDGLDYRKSIIAGLALLVGVGFETHVIFSSLIGRGMWGELLSHGMVAGGMVAIVLTLFMEFTGATRWRIELELDTAVLQELDAFLRGVAVRLRWNAASTERLRAAGEESLMSLVQADETQAERARVDGDQDDCRSRRLRVVARNDQGTAELEFIAAMGAGNLEDRMVLLPGRASDAPNDRELSLRLLRHHASSVRHRQYHDIDVVTVRIDGVRKPYSARGNRQQ